MDKPQMTFKDISECTTGIVTHRDKPILINHYFLKENVMCVPYDNLRNGFSADLTAKLKSPCIDQQFYKTNCSTPDVHL